MTAPLVWVTIGTVAKHTAFRLLLPSLACVGAMMGGCKRRTHEVAPTPSATLAERQGLSPSPPDRLPPGSAVVPSAAAFADGGAPKGYEHATVWDLVPAGDGAAVLLLDSSHTTVLPIFVGGTEALTIRLDLDGTHYGRPLTHDLLASIVKELGGQPVKAQIDDLRDDTYFGSVFVRQGERILQLDARPSDAIAIALRSGAPLYVSRSIMLSSGVPREEVEKDEKERDVGKKKNPISL
jgi:bifunctional DNase/RNase